MGVKTIPLRRLKADPQGTLSECTDSGQPVVIELPGARFVAIQPLELKYSGCGSDTGPEAGRVGRWRTDTLTYQG